jgi:hypothetical protein
VRPQSGEALTHPNHYIRTKAAWVLCEVEKERARDVIQAAFEKEADEELKREFQRMLDWMGQRQWR